MPRPNRSEDIRPMIVTEALALLDEDGLAGLSIRKLAARLGMRGPSLYHYFPTKEAILDAINDHISESIAVGEYSTWEQSLRAYGMAYRTAMAHHPYAVALLMSRPVTSPTNPGTLSLYERQLQRLTGFGWSLSPAWQAVMAIEALVLGDALQAGAPAFELDDPGLRAACPLVAAAIVQCGPLPTSPETFERSLDGLIAGLSVSAVTA